MAHFTLLRTDLAEAPSDWLCRHAARSQAGRGGVGRLPPARAATRAGWHNRVFLWKRWIAIANLWRSCAALTASRSIAPIWENAAWPYAGRQFDAIVVCRYLHRPLFAALRESLKPGGILIYETFMQGHEAYGRPTNPDFLLRENELEQVFGTDLAVLAFEQGLMTQPKSAMMQRIAARKPG